jgi:biotin carboxyl carrier protein
LGRRRSAISSSSLEAAKVETSISARRDGKINEVLVSPGQLVDAGDLLVAMDLLP